MELSWNESVLDFVGELFSARALSSTMDEFTYVDATNPKPYNFSSTHIDCVAIIGWRLERVYHGDYLTNILQ